MSTDQRLTLTDRDGDTLTVTPTHPASTNAAGVDVRQGTQRSTVFLTAAQVRELADHLHTLADERDPRPEADTATGKDTGPEEATAPAESLEATARRRCLALTTLHGARDTVAYLPDETQADLLHWLAGEPDTIESA